VPPVPDDSTRIHLDTDFGGDPDDAAALALLLGSPRTEIAGITTNLDAGGRRAGCVVRYLELAGRTDVPVVAGADASMTTGRRFESTWNEARYWPEAVEPRPAVPGAALDLLDRNIAHGATVVAIGALTNLARLELQRPGALRDVRVVATAGWLDDQRTRGLPDWGPAMDFNVQCDTRAAATVAAVADLTLVTLPASITAQLRGAHLDRLRAAGPVGALLARQSQQHASDNGFAALAAAHAGLADDLVNFHWDPVTCAVALDWPCTKIETRPIETAADGNLLRFRAHESGRPTRVVVGVDGDDFNERWLAAVEAIV